MVLTGGAGWLHRVGFARPHVFLLALPGGTAVRLAGERHAHRRGWPLAESPADADVLVVCGQPSTAGRDMACSSSLSLI